jgi:hypothetical protein
VSSCDAQIVRLGIPSSRALHLNRFDASSIFAISPLLVVARRVEAVNVKARDEVG